MGTCALRVAGVGKAYHGDGHTIPILDDIDLSVEDGEVFALLGPSGCGKSTLLRMIAGIEHITAGQIQLGDDSSRQPHRNGYGGVGIVFQDPLLLPWLSVSENVALGLGFQANRAARELESVEQVLSDFGLGAVAHAYPTELSGGQAQRVNFARAIVTHPKILLLDEPFAALDPRTRLSMQDWLLRVVHERKLTVIIVTHDVDEALYLGNRVGLLSTKPGRLIRLWDVAHGDVAESGRRGDVERAQDIRREILDLYQSDVPTSVGPPNWVI